MSILIMLQIYIQGKWRPAANAYVMLKDMVCYDYSFIMVCHSGGHIATVPVD